MNLTLTVSEEQLEQIVAQQVEAKLKELGVARRARDAEGGEDDEDIIRGAEAIAEVLGCKVSRVYNLRRRKGALWPVQTEGRGLWARRGDLRKFLAEGGAYSP